MLQVLHFIEKLWEIYVKRFHLNNAILSFGIIVLAWIMDIVLALYACPLCILTRYVFGTFAFFSLIAALPEEINLSILGVFISLNDRFTNIQNIFIFGSLFFGVGVTSRQIYIQGLSSEGLANLSGCGMPLETTIEFYGFFEGIYKTLQGGPSCAEEGWRFIFNFAEWGLIFFLIFIFVNLLNVFRVLKKV